MRKYELTFVIPGDRTSVQVSAVDETVRTLAKKHKISILNEEDWGKKQLAYTIFHLGKRQNEGYYHHFVVETDSSNIQAFDRAIQMNDEIIRHLLVLAEDEVEVEATAETPVEAAEAK